MKITTAKRTIEFTVETTEVYEIRRTVRTASERCGAAGIRQVPICHENLERTAEDTTREESDLS